LLAVGLTIDLHRDIDKDDKTDGCKTIHQRGLQLANYLIGEIDRKLFDDKGKLFNIITPRQDKFHHNVVVIEPRAQKSKAGDVLYKFLNDNHDDFKSFCTAAQGNEHQRLRICPHFFNSKTDVDDVIKKLEHSKLIHPELYTI